MTPFYRRSWFKVFTGLIILCLLFISFLPFAIRYGIEQWYLKQDVDSVSVQDIDLNLFTGKLHLKDMRVVKDDKEILKLSSSIAEFDWLPLFKKRSFFPQIQIDGFTTTITQRKDGSLHIGGIKIPHASAKTDETITETTAKPWGFGLRAISIKNVLLHVKTPVQTADFSIDDISLDKLESWSQEDSQFDFSGKINNAVLSSSARLRPFAKQPLIEGSVKLSGLDIAPLAVHLKEQLQGLNGLLSLNTEFVVEHDPDKGTNIKTKGSFDLNNLLIKQTDNQLALDKLNWQGATSLRLSKQQTLLDYLVEGKIASENAEISVNNLHHYHHDALNWDGTVKSAADGASIPQVLGMADAKGITLQHLVSKQELFHSGSMAIQDLQVLSKDQISSKKILLQDIRTLYSDTGKNKKKNPALLQAASLEIADTSFTGGNLIKLGNTRLNDAMISINRQKDGQLQQLAQFKAATPTQTKAPKQDKDGEQKKPPVHFSVSQFDISGKSRIRIVDAAVSPAFKTELLIKKANIRNIDSSRPNIASPFVVDANLDKYSSLHFDGEAFPFSSPLSLKLNGKIVNISLPPISSYTASLIGYDLTSGQLNADLKMNIEKGKIDADSKMKLSNLEVKASDAKKSEELSSQLNMPLDSALSLLRDKNNDIELNIPVTGDINKPDFDISGVINKAIGSAMKTASMTYLINALQPYGSLITLAKLAKAAADHVSLNPITFAPGSSQMDDNALAYSAKIAGLMKERPKLRIKLCGKVTPSDSQQLIQQKTDAWKSKQQQSAVEANSKARPPVFIISDEQLLELASTRADTVKNILVNDHKIDAARLFLCKPAIDQEKDGKPRIDLTI
jgi:hypothetical protein